MTNIWRKRNGKCNLIFTLKKRTLKINKIKKNQDIKKKKKYVLGLNCETKRILWKTNVKKSSV